MSDPLVSVIIPVRNEMPYLWFTLQNLILQKIQYEFPLEIIVVNDGSTDRTAAHLVKPDVAKHIRVVTSTGVSPAHARNLGAEAAKGKYLLFVDGHVLLQSNFWDRYLGSGDSDPDELPDWLEELESGLPNPGVLHFGHCGDGDEWPLSHYELTLDLNFWGTAARLRAGSFPGGVFTEIAANGQACFAVPRAAYFAMGGFDLPFKGYAGEEVFFDLRAAMLGYKVYTTPHVRYYHCTEREQNWVWTNEELFFNTIMGAYVLSGVEQTEKILDYQLKHHIAAPYHRAFRLIHDGVVCHPRMVAARNAMLAKQVKSLEEVLEDFKARKIPM